MRVALGGHALSQVELRNTKAGHILSLPCLGFPLMTHAHLQAVELGQGLTLPGLSFPSGKLRFLHAYLTGGSNTKHTESLPAPCYHWSWFGGSISFWGLCWREFRSSVQHASLPPKGLQRGPASPWSPASLWVLAGASACPWSLFSVLIGCHPCPAPRVRLMKAAPPGPHKAPMGLPSVVSRRKGANCRKVLGRPGVGSISKHW